MSGSTSFDAIVVGGGTAGCVLAARLSENASRSVLLLEAGPDFPDPDALPAEIRNGHNSGLAIRSGLVWLHAAVPNDAQRDEMVLFPRGKLVGGTAAIDGRVHLRGLPEDYDGWVAQGCRGWGFADVLPYLRRMETDLDFPDEDHGTAGPLPVRRHPAASLHPIQAAFGESCRAAGFAHDADMNSPRSTGGVGCFPFNVVDGVRVSTATSYLAAARGRANLTVMGDAQVRRIVVTGGEAQGVEALVAGETVRFDAGAVVVSAGSFATPQLLMLSGIGPAAVLEPLGIPVVHDLPGVGENLQDHPLVNLVFRSSETVPDDTAPVLQVGLRTTAPGSDARLDLHYLPFSPVSADASQYGFGDEPFVGTNVAVSLRAPRGAGRVSLASADPDADPAIAFRFLDDPWDLARMREAVRLGIALTERPAYRAHVAARVAPDDETLARDEALDRWLRASVTAAHASGSCRMGAADDGAVVDARCRVHGIGRLWLADASVMPAIVRANTAATVTLIAERVAEWVGAT